MIVLKGYTDSSKIYTEYVEINGLNQFMLHQVCEDPNKPVLLFLHGGPGKAESIWSYYYQENWNRLFSVVHWDQRGAGKTLKANPQKTYYPTADLILMDLHEVVEYLKTKYKKEKIILLGYSWGSFLGMTYLRAHPENVLYYIGTGQLINFIENEKTSFHQLVKVVHHKEKKSDIRQLQKIGTYPGDSITKDTIKKLKKVRCLQNKHNIISSITKEKIRIYKASPLFQPMDIYLLWKSMKIGTKLYMDLLNYNLYQQSLDFSMPIFFILGEKDWHTPCILAKTYFESIKAPYKQIHILKNAGHDTMLDKPEAFFEALKNTADSLDILYKREQV